jgi:tRNA nucleotidyltransferase (CCA-adding enzyme)
LPFGTWAGYTSKDLARGSVVARRGDALAASTLTDSPDLRSRLPQSDASLVTTRPATNLHADGPTTAALELLAREIDGRGGRALVVGGAVRDMVLGRLSKSAIDVKDIDIEVYGIDPAELRGLISAHFPVDLTGAAFAVLKAHIKGTKHPLDISVPRRERATGTGHRDFEVTADPSLTFTEAAYRRDFTIGAMGYDPLTGELIDPYGGAADLAAGVLRHVSPAFDEDPLRALRAARFAARFALTVHPDTVARCQALRPKGDSLPAERLWGELSSTIYQAPTPGRALHVLNDIDWIDLFPQIAVLRGVEQDPGWHPEGDVFIHTAAVLDYWGTHLRTDNLEDDLVVAVAAMCHDLGKATTTYELKGRLTAHGHEGAGVAPAKALLEALGQYHLAGEVTPLVANHLAPVVLTRAGASSSALRRLAVKVPRLDLLCLVAKADQGGRPPQDPTPALAEIDRFYDRVKDLKITRGPLPSLAKGEHLIDLGLTPGPQFKPLLAAAYEAQMDGTITTEAQARDFLTALVTSTDV